MPRIGRFWQLAVAATVAGTVAVLAPAAGADVFAGRISVVSLTPTGGFTGLLVGDRPAVSATGRFVAFSTSRGDGIQDPNGLSDIYLRDLTTGSTTLVSVGLGGTAGNAPSRQPAISADGRLVAFLSAASDLVPADGNGLGDIFVRDVVAGTTRLVSRSATGRIENGFATQPSLSANGRYVAFLSTATNLTPAPPPAGANEAYRVDLTTGGVKAISAAATGRWASGASGTPVLSSTGRYAAFGSADGALGFTDTNRVVDVFRKDLQTGALALASQGTGANGITGGTASTMPAIGGDGNAISFTTTWGFGTGTPFSAPVIALRDFSTGQTSLESLTEFDSIVTGVGQSTLSGNGRLIAYDTPDAAKAGDSNGLRDVYVRDRLAGGVPTTQADQVALVSKGLNGAQSNGASSLPVLSANGNRIVFVSKSADLVAGTPAGPSQVYLAPLTVPRTIA
jgi:Tol biopolymer transport system component